MAPSSSDLATSLASVADGLLGVPYLCGGRAPATGLDCWGVVVVARRALGRAVEDVPGYPEDWAGQGQDHLGREIVRGPWDRVEDPAAGDVALYATRRDGLVDHAGLVLGPGWGLQQRRGTRVHRYRLAAMAPFLVGYYRRRDP